nr:MAG TPA: FeoC like transcriptional regulator [Caudoviricetes sp.]
MTKFRKFLDTQPRGTATVIARKMGIGQQNVYNLAKRGIKTITMAKKITQTINELYGTKKIVPADLCEKI